MSCCIEAPAEQKSNEWMPVVCMLPVLVAVVCTPLCSSCKGCSSRPDSLDHSVSAPVNPSPGSATPILPRLRQKWVEKNRLLSFLLCADSEIAVLLYNLNGRELRLTSKQSLKWKKCYFSHGGFCALIFLFLLEDSHNYMDWCIFCHLRNESRGKRTRFLPVQHFIWFCWRIPGFAGDSMLEQDFLSSEVHVLLDSEYVLNKTDFSILCIDG